MLVNKYVDGNTIENLYDSSNIVASKYNMATKKLAIIFKNGQQYLYHDVKENDYLVFEGSDSQGKALNSNIISYKYEKVGNVIDVTPILEQINNFKNKI
jgi:hypothetical protein